MTDDVERARFDRRLALLPMVPRVVYLLRRLDAMEYGAIGFRLGISRARVLCHMTRAIQVMAFGADGENGEGDDPS